MRLSVCHTVVAGNNGLGRRVVISGIVTQAALLHGSETAMSGLGQSLCFHIMPFQHGGFLVIRTVTEAAVGAALGDSAVVLAVYIFMGNGLQQILSKLRGAVIQPIDVLQIAIFALAHIGVERAAGFTNGFRIMIPSVVGVFAGRPIQHRALADAIHHGAIRVFDITAHGSLPITGIFRNAEHLKGCGLAAFAAFEGLTCNGAVGIQFVGTVVGCEPMLSRIMVAVLLGG